MAPQLPHFTIDLDISSKYPMHLFMQKVVMLKYEDSTTLKTYFYNFVVSDNTVKIIAEQYISLLVAQHAQITCCQAKLGILNALNVL